MKRISLLVVLVLLAVCGAHAQTTSVIPLNNPRFQFVSSTGAPAANYCLYSYSAGTSSPLANFTDYTGSVQNSEPVTLDANGTAAIWLGPYSYKLVLYSNGTSGTQGTNCYGGTLQWTSDNIPGSGIGSGSVAFSSLTAASNSNAGTFAMSGNTLDLSAATAFKSPISAGAVPTANGLIAYDSTANTFVFGVNGATTRFGIASAAACSAGQFVSTPATAEAAAICSAPSLTGSTLTNVTINGTSTFNGAITSSTIASTTISASTLSGTITNSGNISGGTLTSPAINTGIPSSSTGVQHFRTTGCTLPNHAFPFNNCGFSASFNGSFADTNYDATCTAVNGGDLILITIVSKSTTGVSLNEAALTVGNDTPEVDCIAIHD